jgi:hypothetical protein
MKLSRLTPALATSTTVILAACGGSNDGSATNPTTSPNQFSSMETWFSAQSRINVRNISEGKVSMPISGTASYQGVANHRHRPNNNSGVDSEILMANVVLLADFETGTISGLVGNFIRSNGEGVAGEFSIENGIITDSRLVATIDGGILINGQYWIMDGSVDGAFGGQDAAGIQAQYNSNTYTGWGIISTVRTDFHLAQ